MIAFPKTARAQCLMTEAPSARRRAQLARTRHRVEEEAGVTSCPDGPARVARLRRSRRRRADRRLGELTGRCEAVSRRRETVLGAVRRHDCAALPGFDPIVMADDEREKSGSRAVDGS